MASTIFMGNGGGGGDVEKALRKIVKDEVRKEQLKYGNRNY